MWEQLSFGDQEWGLGDKFVLFPVWKQTLDASKDFSSWSNCSWQCRFISWACARYDKSSCFFSSSILDLTLEICDSRSVYIETHLTKPTLYSSYTFWNSLHFLIIFWTTFHRHQSSQTISSKSNKIRCRSLHICRRTQNIHKFTHPFINAHIFLIGLWNLYQQSTKQVSVKLEAVSATASHSTSIFSVKEW